MSLSLAITVPIIVFAVIVSFWEKVNDSFVNIGISSFLLSNSISKELVSPGPQASSAIIYKRI